MNQEQLKKGQELAESIEKLKNTLEILKQSDSIQIGTRSTYSYEVNKLNSSFFRIPKEARDSLDLVMIKFKNELIMMTNMDLATLEKAFSEL